MTTIELSPLTVADVASAVELEGRTYPSPWPEQVFRDELAAEGRFYLKASAGGKLVGYGGLMIVMPDAHITTVVVDSTHRGARIGTRLMLELTEEAIRRGAGSLTLEVRMSNQAAQGLYRRFGMSPVGVRKQYYTDEDALIMWVHDVDSPAFADRLARLRGDLT
ncbi:ribosomal protein S18-alanine N-acetyltransferase [soil metagenome]